MGNAASVIPNKLHTAREAVGHSATTAREAVEHTASTAREAVRHRVHHARKVPVLSAAGAVHQLPRKDDRVTPTIAESKHDNEEVPPGGGGHPPSRGHEINGSIAAAASTAGVKAPGVTSTPKRAGSVREKDGDSLKDTPSAGRGRGLAQDDKATSEGGSSSQTQDQRGDVGLQQHRNSRRGEVGHSAKNPQQEGKQDKESGGDLGERCSGGDVASVGTTSGTSGESYTSSSYSSSGSDDSCDDDASDDTFFVPQVRYENVFLI